jgi:hypothetical protein
MPPSEMTATSVVPPPMSTTIEPEGSCDGQTASDGGRHRLLDRVGPTGTGVVGGFLDGPTLDRGDARRDADTIRGRAHRRRCTF